MQLVDLHRHLDGSLRPSTVAAIARELGVTVPINLAFTPGMGLSAALSRFDFTLSLLQTLDAVQRVAAEMCEDAEEEGVSTLEIRFAPQLHGHPVDDVVDAALGGVAGRAGLILCGLYGEDPSVLDQLVQCASSRPGVVGIDLAGGPSPGHVWGLEAYARPFRAAAEAGLGRTVHAGEGRPATEIRAAIEILGAQRIGHGTSLLDDPKVLELVLERGVTIEACPTSNWQTGIIESVTGHPLLQWLELGVEVCVCADNTLLSQTNAAIELSRVAAIPGITDAHIQRCIESGHAARFVRDA